MESIDNDITTIEMEVEQQNKPPALAKDMRPAGFHDAPAKSASVTQQTLARCSHATSKKLHDVGVVTAAPEIVENVASRNARRPGG